MKRAALLILLLALSACQTTPPTRDPRDPERYIKPVPVYPVPTP